jgi:HEAT repeat protein
MSSETSTPETKWVRLAKVLIICVAAVLLSIFAYHISPDVRRLVVRGQSLRGGAGVPSLLRHFRDEEQLVWVAAQDAICTMGSDAVPQLTAAVAVDEEPLVRADAAKILGMIGPKAKDAIPTLVAALRDADADVRAEATDALGKMSPEARAVLPELVRLLDDPAGKVRARACETVSVLGPMDEKIIQTILRLLKSDPDSETRAEAAEALGRLGPAAKDNEAVLKALLAAVKDPNLQVRKEAMESIFRIAPEKAPTPEETTRTPDRDSD